MKNYLLATLLPIMAACSPYVCNYGKVSITPTDITECKDIDEAVEKLKGSTVKYTVTCNYWGLP